MSMDIDDLPPSQVTNEYWVYAFAPGTGTAALRPGKWLVFVLPAEIDNWWTQIKHATEQGRLGIQAKAATAHDNPLATSSAKLICVYTRDWLDHEDVRRVLRGLRGLGISWRLAYKTDEATVAGVYGRGAAVYVSQPDSPEFEDRHLKLTVSCSR
jgi:hypothetical protein